MQFLLRSADADVERYLKLFTFVPMTAVSQVMQEHSVDPGKRKAQHLLACEVLTMVHGEETATRTQREHQSMRNPTMMTQTSSERSSGTDGSSIRLPTSEVMDQPLARVLHTARLAASRSEATRMVGSGAVYLASVRGEGEADELQFTQFKDPKAVVTNQVIVGGKLLVRIGKWKVKVIEVVDEDKS